MNFNSGDGQTFLIRLTSIVEANLSDENFGVSELAKKIGLSRSQIHRKLKSVCNKSVSQFIREVRLEKAKVIIGDGKLTVSEIAYKVGFGSPSYFIKCFHDYFGYPPGEAKSYVESNSDAADLPAEEKTIKIKAFKKTSKLIPAIIIVIVLFGTYLVYQTLSNNPSQNNPDILSKSIAILPLKNLSNNPEIQYLADGIMEDILSRLSHVDGLVVKSRISSEKIGDENLTAKEIYKELNVGYFLDGSIMPENDKIRITVQLISAKEDKLIWANHFDNDLTKILTFITAVSRQITEQLEIILSPEEKEQVEKIYTENKEAYKLYLEGRFYYQLRTKKSFEKSIALYNQALALDSGFCLAYAALYFFQNFFLFVTGNKKKF